MTLTSESFSSIVLGKGEHRQRRDISISPRFALAGTSLHGGRAWARYHLGEAKS